MAADKLERRRGHLLAENGGGRESGKMKGRGERERSGALAEAAAWLGGGRAHDGSAPSSFLLLLNFIFMAC